MTRVVEDRPEPCEARSALGADFSRAGVLS
jgi:hypothetical protein